MRKYRLSEQTRQYCYEEEHGKQSVTLRQIVALIDFADVKAGSEGGWVDEECALSQQGECWIYDVNSVVFAGARIRDDARLTGFCVVSHEATIKTTGVFPFLYPIGYESVPTSVAPSATFLKVTSSVLYG